jgi:hypothetical protein
LLPCRLLHLRGFKNCCVDLRNLKNKFKKVIKLFINFLLQNIEFSNVFSF